MQREQAGERRKKAQKRRVKAAHITRKVAVMRSAEVVKQKALLKEMEEDTRRNEARKVKLEKKKKIFAEMAKDKRIQVDAIRAAMKQQAVTKRYLA